MNRPGRSKKDAPHVRLYHDHMATAAWRSLSFGARCLYIELKALYNGSNNGKLFLSAREAARRLDSNRMSTNRWFDELVDRGFIKPAQMSSFDWKAGAGERKATTWILTEYYAGSGSPTADFRRWAPSRNSERGHAGVTDWHSAVTACHDSVTASLQDGAICPSRVTDSAENDPHLSLQSDTDNTIAMHTTDEAGAAAAAAAAPKSGRPLKARKTTAELRRKAAAKPKRSGVRRRPIAAQQ